MALGAGETTQIEVGSCRRSSLGCGEHRDGLERLRRALLIVFALGLRNGTVKEAAARSCL